MKKYLLILSLLLSLLSSCDVDEKDNLVILYTNDVHCAVDENIGYAGLVSYKKELEANGDKVILVDCGDHIQGAPIGSVSKGSYCIDIMNEVGYSYAVPGNHEFDYGADRFLELSKQTNFKYLSSNLYDLRTNERVFEPYTILTESGYRIGLLGVCTPLTISSGVSSNFYGDTDHIVYDFCNDETGEKFYSNIQSSIDELNKENVDYIIALAHLGDAAGKYSSESLIKNTSGIDVLLDGHSHSVNQCQRVKDKSGNYALISQTGTGLANIGELVISSKGNLSTGLISSYSNKDEATTTYINNIKEQYEASLNVKIAHSDYDLVIYDPQTGQRIVRKQETNLGDLITDAYKWYGNGDFSIINGGTIRVDVPAGDITYKTIQTVLPFGNTYAKYKVTGEMIKNYLENGAEDTPGESGAFVQVSGITYSIDTLVESSVVRDSSDTFVRVDGDYRVKDIYVNGEPLDLNKEYICSSTSFVLADSADGAAIFKDAEIIEKSEIYDYQMVASYIKEELGGEIPSRYSNPYGEGRINVLIAE